MKYLIILFIILMQTSYLIAQESTAVSKKTSLIVIPKTKQKSEIKKEENLQEATGLKETKVEEKATVEKIVETKIPPALEAPITTTIINEKKLPNLSATLDFEDPSGNNMLDANEKVSLRIKVKNDGKQLAKNCTVRLDKLEGANQIKSEFIPLIGDIQGSETKEIVINLNGSDSLKSGLVKYSVNILEDKGFDLDPPLMVSISTREYQPPINEVVDFGVQDWNRNQKIEKREPFDITFRIQNRGETISKNTIAKVVVGENVIADEMKEKYEIGDLKPGEYKDLVVSLGTNSRTTTVKLSVIVEEESKKYSYQKSIDLPINVVQKKVDEIIIAKNEQKLDIPDVANLKLDIAENIPAAAVKKQNAVAFIIGNKDYIFPGVPAVEFALNDASMVRRYVVECLGFKDENVILRENATQSDFIRIFGSETNPKGQLYDYAARGFEVFIYYSGHGAPNPDNQQGYIVPVDCDPNKVALNGYALNTLYRNLEKTAEDKKLEQLTIVMDACFSGSSQSGAILSNISPIYIKTRQDAINYSKSIIFSSSTGEQVSNWYNDKKQSMFTYFFLKGLKGSADSNQDSIITAKELYEFTADEINGVPYFARRLNGRTQTPTIMGEQNIIMRK